MQAIHNVPLTVKAETSLFQRAKIQDKCKQFTTQRSSFSSSSCCFKEQRYKINASNSQLLASAHDDRLELFQRAKIQDKCKQFTTNFCYIFSKSCCFKEQRYKINASNSQLASDSDSIF